MKLRSTTKFQRKKIRKKNLDVEGMKNKEIVETSIVAETTL